MRPKRAPLSLGSLALDVTTVMLVLAWLLPLLIALLISVRPQAEPLTRGGLFFGSHITWDNFANAWRIAPWPRYFVNTIVFVVGTLLVQLVTVTMAAYAFARLRFWGRGVLLILLLLQIMIPAPVLIAQNYTTIVRLGLFDSPVALMLPYWGSAFGVLLLRQAFRSVPYELEEAARMDGANLLALLRHVYIPLTVPSYVAFGIVSVSSHWNEFLWPLLVTNTDAARPLTLGLYRLAQTAEVGALYNQQMAGTLMVIAPLMLLFLLFQRQFIESFAQSGIK